MGLQVGDAIGAGHGNQFDLDAKLGTDQVGHVDIEPLGLQVNADKTVGRIIGRNGNADLVRFEHPVKRALCVRPAPFQKQRQAAQQAPERSLEAGHNATPKSIGVRGCKYAVEIPPQVNSSRQARSSDHVR